MNNIVKNIINIISSVLFFGVFFVIGIVTNSQNIFSWQNILILVSSILVYCVFTLLSDSILNYFEIKQSMKHKDSSRDELFGKFVDDVMNYCTSLGINPAMNFDDENNLEIVDVNKDNQKVINFSAPSIEELSNKNYNLHLEHIKDLINKARESEE